MIIDNTFLMGNKPFTGGRAAGEIFALRCHIFNRLIPPGPGSLLWALPRCVWMALYHLAIGFAATSRSSTAGTVFSSGGYRLILLLVCRLLVYIMREGGCVVG